MNNSGTESQLRIIAGTLRGRKIKFTTTENIRPTPDRIRETLFNWLSPEINGCVCLDLFAGSGVLGFESISRGADAVVFVDIEQQIIKNLKQQQCLLKLDSDTTAEITIIKSSALDFLASQTKAFDIVFLDPPYYQNMIEPVLHSLSQNNMLNSEALVYIEMAKDEKLPTLPRGWQIIKDKVASQVAYYLLQVR